MIDRLRAAADDERDGRADAAVAGLMGEAAAYVRTSGRGAGLLVVIDELGKFLEFAAMNPERQDIYFLQCLAEAAAR